MNTVTSIVSHIVRSLVQEPERVEVTLIPEEGTTKVLVRVAPDDVTRLTRADVRVVRALNTVVSVTDPSIRYEVLIEPAA